MNGNGARSFLAAYRRANGSSLGPRVGSYLALLCIHHVNCVNSRNDFESWRQHHKHRPGIIIIIIITI